MKKKKKKKCKKNETYYYPTNCSIGKEKNGSVIAEAIIIILFICMIPVIVFAIRGDFDATDTEKYETTLQVLHMYEKEGKVNNTSLDSITGMPVGTFSQKNIRYIIMLNYESGEGGYAEIEVSEEVYDTLSVGDIVNVSISEKYNCSGKLIRYDISLSD